MIVGRFVNGRPFVKAVVAVDLTSPQGSRRTFEAEIDFLIDTGADVTVLGVSDLTERLGIPLAATSAGEEYAAFGERVQARSIAGLLFFEHDDRSPSGYRMDFAVPPARFGAFDVSLLGCDVILAGKLTLDANEILLDLPKLGSKPRP